MLTFIGVLLGIPFYIFREYVTSSLFNTVSMAHFTVIFFVGRTSRQQHQSIFVGLRSLANVQRQTLLLKLVRDRLMR